MNSRVDLPIEFPPFSLDTQLLVLYRDGKELNLRTKLCEVLKCLCSCPRGLSLGQLKKCAWGEKASNIENRTVENGIGEIRKVLGPEYAYYIKNRSGRGYVLNLPDINKRNTSQASVTRLQSSAVTNKGVGHSRTAKLEILRLYYPDADLQAQGLFRYSYSVDGQEVATNMASARSWLGITIPIDELSFDRFPVRASAHPLDPVTDQECERLRVELAERNIIFHNKPFYRLESFLPEEEIAIAVFSVAQYADYKIEYGRLEEELTTGLASCADDHKAAFASRSLKFPLRERLLCNSHRIASYGDRLCAGGTNVLLGFRAPDEHGYLFSVKRRSARVSTGQRLFSLLPSGMHQPTNRGNATKESSIGSTVLRETLEEMFGYPEIEGEDRHMSPLWFMSKPPLQWIANNREKVRMEIVSFALNLVDGTYEFGVLFAVEDPEFFKTFSNQVLPNQEFDDNDTPWFSTVDQNGLRVLLSDERCADTSKIALVQGLLRLAQCDPQRVTLPVLGWQHQVIAR